MYSQPVRPVFPHLIALTLLLAACGTTVQTKYFLLTPAALPSASQATGGEKQLLISIGPVRLPEYLDRSQIITRRGDAQLDLADGQRWAEPLQENFSRVLAENLTALMGSARVILYPTRAYAPVDYRVTVDVTRFDTSDRDEALLIASWNITDDRHGSLLHARRSEYRLDMSPGAGYPERVTTLSRMINLLGADIRDAITTLEGSP